MKENIISFYILLSLLLLLTRNSRNFIHKKRTFAIVTTDGSVAVFGNEERGKSGQYRVPCFLTGRGCKREVTTTESATENNRHASAW